MFRIGLGQDSHALSGTDKPLILGGVRLDEKGGFDGNSDADVIIHSICNALSSAIGGDSLGTWSDKMFEEKNVTDSTKYLEFIFDKIKQNDFSVENISISVEMSKPRLSKDQIEKIKENIAKLIVVNVDRVGFTLTTGDGLTEFGRGKGAYVTSIVLLKKND